MFELLIIIASSIVVCLSIFIKALFTTELKRMLGLFLISFALAGISYFVILPNFIGGNCCRSCKDLFESEAANVAASIADYFSNPEHTKTPTINDLVHWGDYIPPEKRKSPKRTDSVKESDLIVSIRGKADDEIEIWVIAEKGKCPVGNAYVVNVYGGEGEWLEFYEEN